MSKKCKHNRLKRKLIEKGMSSEIGMLPGTYQGYCSQQCKRMIKFTITQDDINAVYPKGRPGD